MDSSLATEMVEMLEFTLIIYAVNINNKNIKLNINNIYIQLGNYATMVFILDEDRIYDYFNLSTLGVAIGIFHAALPM